MISGFEKWVLPDRRILLMLLFFGFSLSFLSNERIGINNELVIVDKRAEFGAAAAKIGGDDLWKPAGIGSDDKIFDLPTIRAGAVVDVETGKVLWSKGLRNKIAPASLSKLATVMTALDLAPVDKTITVSAEAASQIPTALGLVAGEKLRLDEALSASILTSANDATEAVSAALGKEVGYGTPTFMQLVNLKLKKLGALDSHFVTSTGLDNSQHFSTVYDLVIIAHAAYRNYPFIASTAASEYKRLGKNGDHKVFDLPNWNALLGTYPGVNGLKIGYTENAGHATMVTAKRDDRDLLAVVIGAETIDDREVAAAALLNYGFGEYDIEAFPVSELDLVKRFEDWRRQLFYADN